MYKLKDVSEDKYFEKRICELIEWEGYDAIFSVNFFPVLARISDDELASLLWGYGWEPYLVEASTTTELHKKMANTLDRVIKIIKKIRSKSFGLLRTLKK